MRAISVPQVRAARSRSRAGRSAPGSRARGIRRRLHRQPRHRARRGRPHVPRRRPVPHGERAHARGRLRHAHRVLGIRVQRPGRRCPDRCRRTREPSTCGGVTAPPESLLADGDRTCVHASTAIAGMLEWRRAVGDAPRLPGVDEGDAYGFEREGRAVIAAQPGVESRSRSRCRRACRAGRTATSCSPVRASTRSPAARRARRDGRRRRAHVRARRRQTAAIHLFART